MNASLRVLLVPLALVAAGLLALLAFDATRAAVAAFLDGAFGGRNNFNLYSTLGRFSILLGLAMSVLVSFRAGLLNIGAEGQLVLGGLTAALVGVYLPAPPLVVALAALLAAMAVGAGWAVLAGLIERGANVPLLIGSLLLNYPASYIASYAVSHPFRDVNSGATQSFRIMGEASLPRFTGTILDYGILLIGGTALLVILLERTSVFGYRVRMQGYSYPFARASGYPTHKLYYRTLMISGAIAGMTGFVAVFGMNQRYIDGMLTAPLYAWTGIAAVLMAAIIPWATPLTAFFFAALATGAIGMERSVGIPREVGQIIQAVIVLYLSGVAGKMLSNLGGKGR
ncbi:putative ABC transporter permease [Oceanicola granulosus HTCC2516]|uniref:Putative ABC transporter permease n=1 Tax=Oceanicola granulosus (strain ATCC BAA-861 / DSM 15982 / KCTC 12143 / HTCC2516) TaxID=314256 RepID=Q2CJ90_OCEGH|nr:ABC transporter permease [Oceanicola granulosus]EAR52710.1 putative ABC transporter permease [Oceanicola granulosus HTCC2516]